MGFRLWEVLGEGYESSLQFEAQGVLGWIEVIRKYSLIKKLIFWFSCTPK